MSVSPFGEHALRFPLVPGLDRRALFEALRSVAGVTDVVLAEDTGAVLFDGAVNAAEVEAHLANAAEERADPLARLHEIAVVYDGEDLDELAKTTGLSRDALVELHASSEYRVAMMGFLPGFAYLTGLDPRLVVPRRAQPRTRVPARSVAMAAGYTGIYPSASAGGWHLLGEALDFAAFGDAGARFALGDRVRFVPSERSAETTTTTPSTAAPPPGLRLEIKTARGPAILVDGGRRGHLHEGVPRSGPLVRTALAFANTLAGNPPHACGIELYGSLDVVARGGAILVADDRGVRHDLHDGESVTIANDGTARVRYLAVKGGLDAPVFLGSRSTLLGAFGVPLRRGDTISVQNARSALTLLPGPDATPDLLAVIEATTFVIVAASDRTGTRLESLPLPAVESKANRKSMPLVRGAVEATPSGLIVLGPDHPATGGYPVVAVLTDAAQDAFFALPIGQRVRFVVGRE